jgi:predicted Zn-dependent protease
MAENILLIEVSKMKIKKGTYCAVFVILAVSLFLKCQTLSSIIISDEDEIKIGNKFKQQIIADTVQYPLYSARPGADLRVVKYIDSIGQMIARLQDDRKSLEFTFTVIDDTLVNAFAIPGGHVFVYTGLLKRAENGAEVAGVLAHEIGHITKYHGKKMLASQGVVNFVNTILFGDSASVTSTVTYLLENMAFLKYSRTNEYQADSCSVAYTTRAGINPRGMYSFLQKLGENASAFEKYSEPFSTHPDIQKRLDNVQQVISKTSNVPAVGEKMYASEYAVIRSAVGK